MKLVFAVLVAALSGCALIPADVSAPMPAALPEKPTLVLEGPGRKISLYEGRLCTNEKMLAVLAALVQEEYIPQFRAAFIMWDGEPFEACFLELDGVILVWGEDGEPINPPYGLPKSAFQPEGV